MIFYKSFYFYTWFCYSIISLIATLWQCIPSFSIKIVVFVSITFIFIFRVFNIDIKFGGSTSSSTIILSGPKQRLFRLLELCLVFQDWRLKTVKLKLQLWSSSIQLTLVIVEHKYILMYHFHLFWWSWKSFCMALTRDSYESNFWATQWSCELHFVNPACRPLNWPMWL